MAGTVTVTRVPIRSKIQNRLVEKIIIDWVGDAADGSTPLTTITSLVGYLFKGITIPLSPSPTASYNVKLFDPEATTFNTLITKLDSRSATLTEEVYLTPSAGVNPIVVAGDYQFQITGNVVNSAKGRVILYYQDGF